MRKLRDGHVCFRRGLWNVLLLQRGKLPTVHRADGMLTVRQGQAFDNDGSDERGCMPKLRDRHALGYRRRGLLGVLHSKEHLTKIKIKIKISLFKEEKIMNTHLLLCLSLRKELWNRHVCCFDRLGTLL